MQKLHLWSLGCEFFHWCLFNPVTVSPGCPGRFTEAWPYSSKAAVLNLLTWSFADSTHFLTQCQDIPGKHQILLISTYPSRNSRSRYGQQEFPETLLTTNRNLISQVTRVSRLVLSWSGRPAIQVSPLDHKDLNGFHGGTRSIIPLLVRPPSSKIIWEAKPGAQYRGNTSTDEAEDQPEASHWC